MILSHKHRFIFFCNGKTGSTSIESALSTYQQGGQYDFSASGLFYKKHIPPAFVKASLPKAVWEEYFKFVFVRNPWDWVVSNWKYNFEHLPQMRRKSHGLTKKISIWVKGQKEIYSVDSRESLSASDVQRIYNYLKSVRVMPYEDSTHQSPYVFDPDGNSLVDFVGRFENIEDDFAAVCEKLGLNLSLPQLNKTQRTSYRDYYNPESIAEVARLWEKDISNFGYSFNQQ